MYRRISGEMVWMRQNKRQKGNSDNSLFERWRFKPVYGILAAVFLQWPGSVQAAFEADGRQEASNEWDNEGQETSEALYGDSAGQEDLDITYEGYIGEEDFEAESIDSSEEGEMLISAKAAEGRYRTERLPAIRNQGNYNVCWAISALSLLEINLAQKGYLEPDFSDLHLAYYSYYSVNDPLGGLEGDDYYYRGNEGSFLSRGGNYTMALNALSDWLGAAEEGLVPYSQETGREIVANGLPKEYAFRDVAYIHNFYAVDMGSPWEVKQAIVEYGAVAISYFSDLATRDSWYYREGTAGYYCFDSRSQNHGVVIVGWDDEYDAANFAQAPPGKGAWIVRNSWGEEFGQGGYFYLSYFDKSIASIAVAAEAVFSGKYDHNYQYDGAIYSTLLTDHTNQDWVKAANVFSASGNPGGREEIKAISFETGHARCGYEVSVYVNPTDSDNPESGTLAAYEEGITSFVGKYVVELSRPVYVEEGNSFAVVVALYDGGNGTGIKAERSASYSHIVSKARAESGQSYLYQSAEGSWSDYGRENNANIRIKAYTVNCKRIWEELRQDEYGIWRYYRNGAADYQYVGLAANEYGWWYVENGGINFGYTGLTPNEYGWWYVENGGINFGYTGLVPNEYGWWYVENGGINFGYTGLVPNEYGWWYVENGGINFGYTGLVPNEHGWWYVENGMVNFAHTVSV